jgi:hypothetical protein
MALIDPKQISTIPCKNTINGGVFRQCFAVYFIIKIQVSLVRPDIFGSPSSPSETRIGTPDEQAEEGLYIARVGRSSNPPIDLGAVNPIPY